MGGISNPAPNEEEPKSPSGTGLDIEDYPVLGEDPFGREKFMERAKDFGEKMGQDPALEDSDMEQYFRDLEERQRRIELTPVPEYSGEMPTSPFEKFKEAVETAMPIANAIKNLAGGKLKGEFSIGNLDLEGEISRTGGIFNVGGTFIPAPESEDIDDDPCNAALLCMIAMMKQMQQEEEKEEECQGSLNEQEQGIAMIDQSFNDCGVDPASAVPYLGTGYTDPSPIQKMGEQKTTQASTPVEEYTTFLVIESKEPGFN
jgi:hypothetical protein